MTYSVVYSTGTQVKKRIIVNAKDFKEAQAKAFIKAREQRILATGISIMEFVS